MPPCDSPKETFGTHATVRFTRETFVKREARFDLGDVKVENVIVAFREEEGEHALVEEGSQI